MFLKPENFVERRRVRWQCGRGDRIINTIRYVNIYRCSICGVEIAIVNSDIKKHKGRCKKCVGVGLEHHWNAKAPYTSIYKKVVKTAREKGYYCDLAYEQFLEFTKLGSCHYCDAAIYWTKYNVAVNGSRYNLDRKDNLKGYTTDNLVVCCRRCNITKSDDIPYAAFVEIGKILKAHNVAGY